MTIPTKTAVNSVEALRRFIKDAKPGHVCRYHEGFLFADRQPTNGDPTSSIGIDVLANAVMGFAKSGLVYLLQRRVSANACEYLAIRSSTASVMFVQ